MKTVIIEADDSSYIKFLQLAMVLNCNARILREENKVEAELLKLMKEIMAKEKLDVSKGRHVLRRIK